MAVLDSSMQQKDLVTGVASGDTGDGEDATVAELLALQHKLKSRSNTYPPGQRPEGDLDFSKVISSVPGSTGKLISDTTSAVNPLNWPDIARGIGGLALGGVEKLIPGDQEHEAMWDAAGQSIYDGYGNWNNIKGTLETDPMALLSLLAAAGTGGGAAVGKLASKGSKLSKAGNTVNKVSKAVDPLNMMANTFKGVALNPIGRSLAKTPALDASHLWNQVAKLNAPKGKSLDSILETAVKNKIPPTKEGYAKLETLARDIEFKIDAVIESVPKDHGGVPISKVLSGIRDLRNKITKDSTPDVARDLKAIDAVVSAWRDPLMARHYKAHGYTPGKTFWPPNQSRATPPPPPTVSVRDLHELKKNLHIESKFNLGRGEFDPGKNKARKTISKRARQEVEKNVPPGSDIAGLNRKWGEFIELADPLRKRVDVGNRNNSISLGLPLAIEAGESMFDGGGLLGGALNLGGRFGKVPLAFKMYDWQKRMNDTYLGGLLSQMTNNSTAKTLLRQGLLQSGRFASEE
jgi:hypothetical protein